METFTFLAVLSIVAVVSLLQWLRKGKIKGIPEPPGNYVFGHVFQLGGNFLEQFATWKKAMGPVYQLRILKFRAVIFNDRESIVKFCAKPETAGRMRFGFFNDARLELGEGVIVSDGPEAEEQRQFYLSSFRTFIFGRAETERSLQNEMRIQLQSWEKPSSNGTPFKLKNCSMTYVFNVAWSALASHRIEDDVIFDISHKLERLPSMSTLGHKIAFVSVTLANMFSNAMEEKLQGLKKLSKLASTAIAKHQEDWVPNEPRDVFDLILDKMDKTVDEKSSFHKNKMKYAFSMHEAIFATMDTTSKSIEWLMLYVAKTPRAAAKLHAEIDRVLGDDPDYCPRLVDRQRMPYTQACILETLRMGTVVPIALPHRATKDFEFEGSLIPKGTILIANLYGVHYDPEVWDQPQEFNPDRFLTPEGDKIDASVKNKMLPFSTGRRVCPGNTLALDAMFMYVVNAYRKYEFELVDQNCGTKGNFGFLLFPPENVDLKVAVRHKK